MYEFKARGPVIPFDEVRSRLLERAEPLGDELVELRRAPGRVLVGDLVSPVAVPLFDNSAMDGYAVRSEDLATLPVTLEVVDVSAAGRPSASTVSEGRCVRILTGARMVEGADCVVPVEHTDGGGRGSHEDSVVTVTASAEPGAHIRYAASSVRPGDLLIASGTRLNAGHLGLAASVGLAELVVHRAPRVAVLSTGDELVLPGEPLGPGQIYESNSITLEALLVRLGCSVDVVHAADDAEALAVTLVELSAGHDLIVTSGGVSMGGEYDALGVAASRLGVESWKVAIKPAKPFAFGEIDGSLMVGLPGNPASVLVSFELFVRPLVRKLSGLEPVVPPYRQGVLGADIERRLDGKVHFPGVVRSSDGRWRPVASIQSHLISTVADSEALAVLDQDLPVVRAGTEVRLIPLWN